ncbi:inositol monophosphatase family protein [Georgenia sp. Z1344]|uniref:inositol monophosphatase family protein n=1 Tax=Georgenia sp. Z1344 TaxID=3416706 RepID=UPI003CE93478
MRATSPGHADAPKSLESQESPVDAAGSAPSPADLLAAVRDAADRICDYLVGVTGAAAERELKRDAHDIVTVHDRRSEEIAIEVLRRHVPDARVLGEEGGLNVPAGISTTHDGGSATDSSPTPSLYPTPPGVVTFVVDPIDGTSNFAAGVPVYCTSIAAQVGDETVAAVVRMPELGLEVFAGDDGCHVLTHPLDGSPTTDEHTRVPGPVQRTDIESVLSTGYPGVRDLDHPATLTHLAQLLTTVGAVRSLGAGAAELALVAAGRLDATFGLRTTPWDVSAGAHLVRSAGGTVDHLVIDGDPDAPEIHRPGYLATGPGRALPGVKAILDLVSAERVAVASTTGTHG